MDNSKRGKEGHRCFLPGQSEEEYRACLRKKRFVSKIEAKKAAAQASRRKDAPQIFIYHCAFCGGWHLTHQKPKK